MATISIFSKRAIDYFNPRRFIGEDTSAERAAEIIREVFDEFLERIARIESISALLDTTLETHIQKERQFFVDVKSVEIEIIGTVYNRLDKGYEKLLIASKYKVTAPTSPRKGQQLKAFPVLARKGVRTTPKSLEMKSRPEAGDGISKYASAGEPFREVGDPVFFSSVVNLQVEAREFTKEIAKEAQRRIDRERLRITVGVIDG